MKKILTIALIVMTVQSAWAQKDKLYLINNGFVKGEIIQIDEEYVQITLVDSSNLEVPVKSLTGINIAKKKARQADWIAFSNEINNKVDRQWYFEGALGGIFDDSGNDSETIRLSISSSAMYRWNKWLQFGAGIDYNRYAYIESVPLYVKYVGQFSQVPSKGLYYYAAYGWSQTWKRGDCQCDIRETEGKSVKKVGLGYRFAVNEVSLSLSLGWVQQRIDYSPIYYVYTDYLAQFAPPTDQVIVRQKLNGMEIKMGLIF